MALADIKKRFLFEIRPDLIPEGMLSDTELTLWSIYYKNKLSAS